MQKLKTSPLAWTDGEGTRHMVTFRPVGGGEILTESTLFGVEWVERKEAEAWVAELVTHHGAKWLEPVRKMPPKKLNAILRKD